MKCWSWRCTGTLALLLALAGCGPTPQEQIALDQGRCASFCLSFGSLEFGRCRMEVSMQRDQLNAEERRTRLEMQTTENLARDRQRAREEAQRRDERREYEHARDQRIGCERTMKPIYC